MKRKKVWRYYCEFCRKSGCSGGHMKAHERGCTMNPDRHCSMCDHADVTQKTMPELVAILVGATQEDAEERLARLRGATEGCPACMLAAIRQANQVARHVLSPAHVFPPRIHEWPIFDRIVFDFKAEKERFWGDINDKARADDEYAMMYG